jgi:hypothetical protein
MRGRLTRVCALALTAALCGCAGHSGRPMPETAPRPVAAACSESIAVPRDLLEPGGIVLFGEIHGAQELPAIFGEAVCGTAASGLPVDVGFEMPRDEQASVDAFLASPGAPSDVEALLATPFWSSEYQDGRRSQARVALLDRLRRLRASGLPVSAFLFDIADGEDASERDKKMADSIAAHLRAHPEAVTMALVGEVHAWKTQGAPWDPKFLPMGWYLADAGLRVRSLGRATPAGTVWVCTGGSPGDCGSITTKATGALPSGGTSGIELLPVPSRRGYDGMVATPTLTASPPAKVSHDGPS